MGNLKPGVKYIYERAGGVVYAREFGSSERFEIGRTLDQQRLDQEKAENELWADIREVAREHVVLQNALDKAVMIYNTVKDS